MLRSIVMSRALRTNATTTSAIADTDTLREMALINPAILAWALSQPTGNRWHGLAEAFAGSTTRVSFEGRSIEYRSLRQLYEARLKDDQIGPSSSSRNNVGIDPIQT